MRISKMARFKVKAASVDQVDAVIRKFLEEIAAHEQGQTLLYKSFKRYDDPTAYVHIMTFKDQPAEEKHKHAEYTQAFVKELYPLCVEEPIFTNFTEL